MAPIITVDRLCKQYRLGPGQARYATLREALMNSVQAPWRWLHKGGAGAPDTLMALQDVSFTVAPGEVVGIIGRNGAGKSTLLKILSRITEPTAGEAELRGRVGSLLEVGTGFHPELTGRDNIYLNGAILGMARREIARQFDAIVAFAEVDRFIDTPVKHYSSGMHMRLAFAVAAHLEPEILIVDEVLAVGDAAFQQKCVGRMGEVAQRGRTVLFVSHNMAAVQQLCTTALLLRSGRLQRCGDVAEVIAAYLDDAVVDQEGRFDVSRHPARPRHYQPVIHSIELSAGSGQPRASFRPQEPLTVTLRLVLARRLREPRVAIAIEDSHGRRITTAANYFTPDGFPEIEGEATVRCSFPRLGLGAGRYLISASVGEKNQRLLDSIDAVAWFTVEWDNNYGNGEPYLPVYGPVLSESMWELVV